MLCLERKSRNYLINKGSGWESYWKKRNSITRHIDKRAVIGRCWTCRWKFRCHHSNLKICFILLCISCFLNSRILFYNNWAKRPKLNGYYGSSGKRLLARNKFFVIQFSYDCCLRSHVDPIFSIILSKSCNCHILSAVNAPERNKTKCWQRGYKNYIYIIYGLCTKSQ